MKKHVVVMSLCVAIAALSGCQSRRSESGPGAKAKKGEPTPLKGQSAGDLKNVVAKIDDVTITVGDFQEKLNQQSPYIRARYTSPERKKEFLDNLVRFEVLAKEAQNKGYDKDPEVIQTAKQVMIQKLMKDDIDNRVKLEDISDDECRKFYQEHNEEYNKPAEVRASEILIKDKAKADQVARELSGKAQNGIIDNALFRDLVTKYSEDQAGKERGGDLRYFPKTTTEYPKELVEAAFELKDVGNFTPRPVKAGEGYHLLMLTGSRKALTRSFDEVKRQIQNRLYRDKRTKAMDDYIADLKKKANVKVEEANLAKVMIDTATPTPSGPPGMPPGIPGHGGMGSAPMTPGGGPAAAAGGRPVTVQPGTQPPPPGSRPPAQTPPPPARR